MRGVLQGITHFFAPSSYLRDRFIAAGVDPSRISVSEYGWSLPAAAPPAARTQSSTPLQIGFIGSLMVSKAPDVLLEGKSRVCRQAHAWSPVRRAHRLSRRSELPRSLELFLKQSHVRFHGKHRSRRLPAALARIDILVVPSIWPENSPLVIREAFLAGVPVIASRIGGIPETVSDNVNGLLVEPGDVADLARALRRTIDEPELLARLRAGIPKVRTIENDVMAMRGVWRDFLVKRGAPSPQDGNSVRPRVFAGSRQSSSTTTRPIRHSWPRGHCCSRRGPSITSSSSTTATTSVAARR
jgi:glycosyltransferase involved in cell wall biosynthesis